MREYKFRAFHKNYKFLCDVLDIDFVNKNVYVLPDYALESGGQEEWSFDEVELIQYTGLKDKNKKEIYDRDIIKCDDITTTITWQDGGFQMITSEHQGKSPAVQDRLKRFEVIGNIYENPELLKQ